MRYSLAQFWGVITLLTISFAGVRYLYGTPSAFVAMFILLFPVHTIIYELVEKMSQRREKGKRVI